MSDVENDKPKGYQGWKNYETWAVHLWCSNDQGTHERYEEWAGECYAEAIRVDPPGSREDWKDSAARAMAEGLKRELDDDAEAPKLVDGTMYADLLSAALSEVDWYDIAEAYVEGIDCEEIEKEECEEDDDAE